MKPNYKIYLFSSLSILLFANFFSSCKKFVQVPPPPNLIVSTQIFADSADAKSAVSGLYTTMMGSGNSFSTYNGNITLYSGLSSDELYSTNSGNTDEMAAYTNGLVSTTGVVSNFWSDSYTLIYEANAIIEGLASSKGVSNSARNQFVGEAEVVRAFCYFQLVNLYGAVPLVTTTNYRATSSLPRASTDQIYQQIVSDLTSAQLLLPKTYPSSGRARPNKYTATAFLARVYLYYKNNWTHAYKLADSVINSGTYSLAANLNDVFLTGSTEAIWQLSPASAGYETTEGDVFVPSSAGVEPQYVINSFLFNAFELNDQRKVDWLDSTIVNGQTYYYPYKYKLGYDGNTSPLESYMIFRLAEQYLIRAEAQAEGGGGSLQGAVSDLNTVRNRAGLPNYTGAIDQASVLTAIMHERQAELFCEWGHRWFDLKRTGNVNMVMGSPGNVCQAKGGIWNPDWELYPIYLNILQANPSLTQNPGY